MRICHLCGNQVEDEQFCRPCADGWANKPNPETMSGEERAAEMQLLNGPVEVPFGLIHQRIEALVGRPVWTHEMGLNWDGLVEEARDREHPTMRDVIDLLPKDKPLIVIRT